MEKNLNLKCECGKDFERPTVYKEYQEKHPNVFWKWKLTYCDSCIKVKTNTALKDLSKVVNILIDGLDG